MEIHKYYKAGLFSRELVVKHLSQQHWVGLAGRTRGHPPPGVGGWLGPAQFSLPLDLLPPPSHRYRFPVNVLSSTRCLLPDSTSQPAPEVSQYKE